MSNAYFTGLGMYVPPKVVTNQDLEKMMDTSDAWITERTGIKERHFVENGQGTTDIAIPAVEEALEEAGLEAKDIDMIIFSTVASDYLFPGSGALLNRKLGIPGVPALDIRVACPGFVFGLSIAKAYITSGMYKRVLLVTSEVQSVALDLSTAGRDTAVIFGDGAAAVVVESTESDRGIKSISLHTDGRYAEELMVGVPTTLERPYLSEKMIREGRHRIVMNGRNVFKHAVVKFPAVIEEVLANEGVAKEDLKLVVPHQANLRITEAVAKRLDLPVHQVVYSNIHKYGNTTSASIPIALYEARQEGLIKPGDWVLVAAFGAGFAWGAALIKW